MIFPLPCVTTFTAAVMAAKMFPGTGQDLAMLPASQEPLLQEHTCWPVSYTHLHLLRSDGGRRLHIRRDAQLGGTDQDAGSDGRRGDESLSLIHICKGYNSHILYADFCEESAIRSYFPHPLLAYTDKMCIRDRDRPLSYWKPWRWKTISMRIRTVRLLPSTSTRETLFLKVMTS